MSERIAGKYELIQRIGQGGMADVHLAKQLGLEGFEKQVVIKCIRPHLAGDAQFVSMFLDEARMAARLKHRNVVDIYEAGESGDGTYFIAMEYLRGVNIAELIVGNRGALPVAHALHIAHDAAAGLCFAHEARGPDGAPLHLVHRDVSTVNLFVTLDGVAKLLDFGIAKAAVRSTQTTAGVVKGNYAYMSPEQAAGESVDARSDLFSLGIVLWEMLAGQRLFKGDNDLKVLRQIHAQPIDPPSAKRALDEAAADIDAVVMGLLQRDPEMRTPSARVLMEQIEAVQERHGFTQPVSKLARFVAGIVEAEAQPSSAAPAGNDASTKRAPLVARPAGAESETAAALAVADTVHSERRAAPSAASTVDARPPVQDPSLDVDPSAATVASIRPKAAPRVMALVLALSLGSALAVVFWPRADPSGRSTKQASSAPVAPPIVEPEPKPEPEPEVIAEPEPEPEPTPTTRRRRRTRSRPVEPKPEPKPAPVAAVSETGRIYVPTNTDPFYEVYVDGKHVGKTPFFQADAVEVKAGPRRIEFRSPEDGHVKASRIVDVPAGGVVRVKGPAR